MISFLFCPFITYSQSKIQNIIQDFSGVDSNSSSHHQRLISAVLLLYLLSGRAMTLTRSTDFPGLHHQFSEGDAMGRMRRSKAVMIIKMAIVIALILVLGNHLLLMMDRHHHHKILCFIMADPRSVRPALAVRDTWGGRCDRLLFFR